MISYNQLPETTRVWIYQGNQPFEEKDIPEIRQFIKQFVTNWISHNRQLKGYGDIYHRQFIVLMVDESQAGASGCSIDKSVAFIRAIQQKYGVDLFDRMTFTYKDNEEIKAASRDEFARLYSEGTINDDTLVFDTLVNNKGAFDQAWVKPLKDSWHARMV